MELWRMIWCQDLICKGPMRSPMYVILAGLFLPIACAQRGAVPDQLTKGASYTLSLQVEATGRADAVPRTIAPGEVLHSGDRFALRVAVDRPLHVYVVRYSAAGWSTQLFPTGEDRPLQPGEPLHLPMTGNSYRLDDNPGREEIHVLASPRLLDAPTCARLRLPCAKAPSAELVRGDDQPPPEPPPPPPPPDGVPDSERPAEVLRDGQQYTLRQRSPLTDQAILKFTFEHHR